MPNVQELFKRAPHPGDEDIEVVVLGAGTGECILVHLGRGKWVIVDSFCHPDSGDPIALDFLRKIGAQPEDVVAIVVTHWHDDHIRGAAELVKSCPLATFFCSDALLHEEFLTVIDITHRPGTTPARTPSGIAELAAILETLDSTDNVRGPEFAKLGGRLITPSGKELPVRIVAPSGDAVYAARTQFGALTVGNPKARPRLALKDPNAASVVLWIEVGDRRVLLPGDLDRSPSSERGWLSVLEALASHDPAQVYKVAHHGSRHAHEPRVFQELLSPRPHVATTAFTRHGKPLPPPDMRSTISRLTSPERARLVGVSKRQQMTFLSRGRRDAKTSHERLARRKTRAQTGITRKAGQSGMIRHRAGSTATEPRDWLVMGEGNCVKMHGGAGRRA